jgi:hypothetical protein
MKWRIKINRLMHCLAEKLSEKAAGYSRGQQRFLLVMFCLLFSVISSSILVETFYGSSATGILVKPVKLPRYIGQSLLPHCPVISEKSFLRVEQFRHMLDSISRLDTSFYKEIIRERPGLTDSIDLFEKLYHAQSKK